MNALLKNSLSILALTAASVFVVSQAAADPLPGRDVLKFSQQPMDGMVLTDSTGAPHKFWGHDELSTAYSVAGPNGPTPYRGIFMADDFADKFNSPVVHVKWWGSYLNNVFGQFPVDKFLISFESDVPQDDTNPFSHPGVPLLNQIVRRVPVGGLAPGSGTYTESLKSPGGPPLSEALYEYNAELHLGKEFFQKPDTVYWLKIVALVDLPPGVAPPEPDQPNTFIPKWGWHNRDYTIMDPYASTAPAVFPGEFSTTVGPVPGGFTVWHFQDDAVTGQVVVDHLSTAMGQIMPLVDQAGYKPTRYLRDADGPPLIERFSKDLAFELYTIPEPATWALMATGLAAAIALRKRTSRQ